MGLQNAAIMALPNKEASFLVHDHKIHQKIHGNLEVIYFEDTIQESAESLLTIIGYMAINDIKGG